MTAAEFISALRSEYVTRSGAAVGDYFDKHGDNPQYEQYEDEVRNSPNPAAKIAEIEAILCPASRGAPCKTETGPSKAEVEKKDAWSGATKPQESSFEFADWCANHSCLSRLVRRQGGVEMVQTMLEECGKNPEEDEKYKKYSYSLLFGLKPSTGADHVEIEDTESKEMQTRAMQRLTDFLKPMYWAGGCIYGLTILTFLCVIGIFFVLDCGSQGLAAQFAITVLFTFGAVVFQFFMINRVLKLQSRTYFEGVPFCRFIANASCLEGVRFVTLLVCSGLYGKFSRAAFVGKMLVCSTVSEDGHRTLSQLFDDWAAGKPTNSTGSFILPALCAIFFVVPLLIQTSRVVRSVNVVNKFRDDFHRTGRREGESMRVNMCIDDFSSIADWAVMQAPARIFGLGAFPLELTDENDALRIWDLFRTQAVMAAANLFPDNIMQFWLMSINFLLVVGSMSEPLDRLQLGLSLLSTFVMTLITAVSLLTQNFMLTVLLGLVMIVLMLIPLAWIIFALTCPVGQFVTGSFQCLQI